MIAPQVLGGQRPGRCSGHDQHPDRYAGDRCHPAAPGQRELRQGRTASGRRRPGHREE